MDSFSNGLILNLQIFSYGAIYLDARKLCKLYTFKTGRYTYFVIFKNLNTLQERGWKMVKNSRIDMKELLLAEKKSLLLL